MIDVENMVFDAIFNAVTASAAYPTANVTTGFIEENAVFPCVVVQEIGNTPYRRTATDDCAENHTRLEYEVSVYTNDVNTAKTTGKDILKIVDATLHGLKFRRIRKNQPLSLKRTLFRQYGRWEVIVGKPITVGDKTVYQMYRR